jgi:hypothetical protein
MYDRADVMENLLGRRRIFLALVIVSAAGVAAAVAVAAPPQRTYVTGNCSGAAFKPRSIILTCGDAGLVASKLQWPQWGTKKAHGAGLGRQKVCKPNCAAGKVAKAAMKVILARPRFCPQDERRHFTKVNYKWLPAAPGEGPNQGSVPLPCSLVGS